jgi:hypothetical protein
MSLEERIATFRVSSYWEGEGSSQRQVFIVVEKDPDRPGGIRTVATPFATRGEADDWIANFKAKVESGQLRQGS